jgi:autotransporter-associated beta strand protein
MKEPKATTRCQARPNPQAISWCPWWNVVLLLVVGFLHFAPALRAATYTWNGGASGSKTGDFNAKQNWGNTNGAPGGIGDDLIFGSVAGSSSTPSLSDDAAERSITFNSTAAAFNIGGAFTLTLGAGGMTNNSANVQAFSVQTLALAAAQTWVAGVGDLTFSGVSIVNGGHALTIDGTQQTTISAAITGTGGLIKKGAGTLVLSNSGNNYSGATQLDSGVLAIRGSHALGDGPLSVSGGTLDIASFSSTAGAVTMDGGSITGTTGVLASLTFDLRRGNISAILGGLGATLTKTTADTVTLSGANTYTGATTVTAGTLALTATGSISDTSGLSIGNGATFQTASAFSLASRGLTIELGSASGGFLAVGGALTYGGAITLTISGAVPSQSWNLIDFVNQTGSASSVTLAGSYNGSLSRTGDVWSGLVGGHNWTFNEANGVLTVLPEPGPDAMLLGGFGTLLGFMRIRRRYQGVPPHPPFPLRP